MAQSAFALRIDDGLELRIHELRHAREFHDLTIRNRAHLRQWMPWVDGTQAVEDTEAFIQSQLEAFAHHAGMNCGIWYKGRQIGSIGYHHVNLPIRKVEIGYWIDEAHEGKGLMTKSCRALISHIFDELEMNRVEIHCAVDNIRSRAIPERLGFRQEGILRETAWLYDHYLDLVIYGMLAREWRK